MSVTYISTLAGVGGFDLAAERLGWECVGQIEIADFPTKVLERRFPNVPRHRDIRTYRGTQGECDVLIGGVPCQDWSVAGKRAGLAGERSGLFFDFARLADEIAPRVVIFENVPGLLSADSDECGASGCDFAVVLRELTGFWPQPPIDGWRTAGVCAGPKRTAVWRVLDSRYAGVAQRRRRVFLVASPRAECAVALLAEREGRAGDLAESGEAGTDVAGTLEGGSGVRGWRVGADEAGGGISKSPRSSQRGTDDPDRMTYVPQLGGALTARDRKGARFDHAEPTVIAVAGGDRPDAERPLRGQAGSGRPARAPRGGAVRSDIAHTLRAEGFDASEDGTGRGTPIVPIVGGDE